MEVGRRSVAWAYSLAAEVPLLARRAPPLVKRAPPLMELVGPHQLVPRASL